MNRLAIWWHSRNTREQRMLMIMATAIALFVYAYGVMRPAHRARAAAQERYTAQQAMANAVAAGVQRLHAAGPPRPDEDRLRAVLDSAGAAGVAIGSQRSDAGTLAIAIDAVDAITLFAWLDTLKADHGMSPHALHIEKRDGRLQAQLQFHTHH